jgi:hypothetical protein
MDDELERIARGESSLSPEDLERFRGRMACKELRLALADLDEAIRTMEAAREEYQRARVMVDRAKEYVRRAFKIRADEEEREDHLDFGTGGA